MDTIERLKIPILADGEYTKWIFEMVANLDKNANLKNELPFDVIISRFLDNLVMADSEYNIAFDVFLNKNYLEQDNREEMEEALGKFEERLGRALLILVQIMQRVKITPFILSEYYRDFVKEQNLNVLQGGTEPLNLSLQIGHWENYLVSEVGWSLRGAFNIVPAEEAVHNTNRAYMGNRISNDSVYVMRIKNWDIVKKVYELSNQKSKAKINAYAIELWAAVFNYFNYIDGTPVRLYNLALTQYDTMINLMEKHANNK